MNFRRLKQTSLVVIFATLLLVPILFTAFPQKASAETWFDENTGKIFEKQTFRWALVHDIIGEHFGGEVSAGGPTTTPTDLVFTLHDDGSKNATQFIYNAVQNNSTIGGLKGAPACKAHYTLLVTVTATGYTGTVTRDNGGGPSCGQVPNPETLTMAQITGTPPLNITTAVTQQKAKATTNAAAAAEDPDDALCKNLQSGDLGFIACPIITTITKTAKNLDETVICLLALDTFHIFADGSTSNTNNFLCPSTPSKDSSDAYKTAWKVFRNLAYALLFIFGLIMVASQVLNLDLFDAYTIKKMLPKLIVATILIAISWELMDFLFNLSNDSAYAIMDLLKAPFQGLYEKAKTTGPTFGIGFLLTTAILSGGAVAVGFLSVLGVAGILTVVLSALLAIFSGFVLLAARNVVAALLVIAAPLALVCYAFEPFKKLFTIWKTLLITILLSVPAIAAVITLSHIGALISYITAVL